MNVFGEVQLSDMFDALYRQMNAEVQSEDKDRVLRVSEYVDYLVKKYRLKSLDIYWDRMSVSERQELIPGHAFPGGGFRYFVEPGQSYRRQVITYHIPCDGDLELLRGIPSNRILWTTNVRMAAQEMQFDIVNWSDDIQAVKQEAEATISRIKLQAENVAKDVEKFRLGLSKRVQSSVSSRAAELRAQRDILASLDLPIRQRSHPTDGRTETATWNTISNDPPPRDHSASGAPRPQERRRLTVFLCHGSEDKAVVRDLYAKLLDAGMAPWLDEVSIVPGVEWEGAIRKAIADCDVVLACLSPRSVTKTGFVQKEIRFALDRADEKPPGTIYIIPVLLESCDVPERLGRWQ